HCDVAVARTSPGPGTACETYRDIRARLALRVSHGRVTPLATVFNRKSPRVSLHVQRGVNVDLGAFALRDAKSFPNMIASNDTMREIAKALRRHVDTATLEKVVNELLDVPGNRDFRNDIEELARELMRR